MFKLEKRYWDGIMWVWRIVADYPDIELARTDGNRISLDEDVVTRIRDENGTVIEQLQSGSWR